ncbi:hypothetical protein BN988_01002 [Oceanobacillus picturae]|uniref:Uncharacterized protein n=1 Tax=Oceanobacillus picturae TaxID=171693 RepID=W9AAL8_9BACI|nr:hypothetical protein BN988_01002 [Oceanobacillus picturae]
MLLLYVFIKSYFYIALITFPNYLLEIILLVRYCLQIPSDRNSIKLAT